MKTVACCLISLAACATALPVNAAYGHYDSLAHYTRAQPATHAEQAGLLSRFLSGFVPRADSAHIAKRSTPKIRAAGIGRTYTHLAGGQKVYDEQALPVIDAILDDDQSIFDEEAPAAAIEKREMSHRGMGEPETASVAQETQIASLGIGPEKIAPTGSSMASPTAASDYPDITITMTFEPSLETIYGKAHQHQSSAASSGASAVPTPITTRVVYVPEYAASAAPFVPASQIKVAGPGLQVFPSASTLPYVRATPSAYLW